MMYEIEAPAKKRKSISDHIFSWIGSLVFGFALVGVAAWSLLQVDTLSATYAYHSPKLISTADGDVSCVMWRTEMECVGEQEDDIEDEPMPEPVLELSYEEAVELLRAVMVKNKPNT